MTRERSAPVDAPEDEDVDFSLHEERVNNKSLCDRRNIDHKNMCSNSTLSEDNGTKLTVNSFKCKKLNVDVLTEVWKTVSELFPHLNQSRSKGARNKFELLVKSMAQFLKKKMMTQTRKNLHRQHLVEKMQHMKSSKESSTRTVQTKRFSNF